jgi:hypothetical protein
LCRDFFESPYLKESDMPIVRYLLAALFLVVVATPALAQDRAYFVTYDHYLEEPGSLEIAVASTTGFPKRGESKYTAPWMEIEYGIRGWWTTELYLEGVRTFHSGSGFTGWRWENRFRPMRGEHRLNPVLYVEYERVNEATRIQKEIVGEGRLHFEPVAELRKNTANEIEAKLILSSTLHAWNIAENFVVEKNMSASEGYEFGYSVGLSRQLGSLASGAKFRLCAENFVAGVEVYGGLGSTEDFTVRGARHYVAPVLSWRLSDHATFKASVALGVTKPADHALVRVGYAYEFGARR